MTNTGDEVAERRQSSISDFYNQAFESGRRQGYMEGVMAAKAHLAKMTIPEEVKSKPLIFPVSMPPSTTIEELKFSLRTYNCLKTARIHTIDDLVKNSFVDLQDIKGMGPKSLWEVENKLARVGYVLATPPPPYVPPLQ